MTQLETPVALIVFNRPEQTKRVFTAVAAARPARLLLIADGPRPDRKGEQELCDEVRRIVSAVDWPCKVETNFAKENLGCRRRVISGLDWVFSLVEEAIILEDDCLPDPSFFPFCAELLNRYRNRCEVALIAGCNPLEKRYPFKYSYSFSTMPMIWGWATWRRVWQNYDEHLKAWPEIKSDGLLNLIFPNEKIVMYWTEIFDGLYDGTGPNTWDYQLVYTCLIRNWLTIVPRRNLIENIGVGPDATHTRRADPGLTIPARPIGFPLQHPAAVIPWRAHSIQMHRRFFGPSIFARVFRKFLSQFSSTAD